MIRIQPHPFDAGFELHQLKSQNTGIGGTVLFVGSVRDMSDGQDVASLTLEHYPGMTEKALQDIEAEALTRWPIDASLIIHRYGQLTRGEDIVLVITASAHREAAFAACHFLIDWLKNKAPFWKLEDGVDGARWVDAKDSDDAAAARWIAQQSPQK
jgi:molybdopterin synthase catalytic subunit